MGWLRLVGSLKIQVSFAEYRLFYRALLQQRPVIWRSLLIVATPYQRPLSIFIGLFSICVGLCWHLFWYLLTSLLTSLSISRLISLLMSLLTSLLISFEDTCAATLQPSADGSLWRSMTISTLRFHTIYGNFHFHDVKKKCREPSSYGNFHFHLETSFSHFFHIIRKQRDIPFTATLPHQTESLSHLFLMGTVALYRVCSTGLG